MSLARNIGDLPNGDDAPVFACRAWVNFNGTGTIAIRDSGNVTSITDNGVGDTTVTYTTAMPDANYVICVEAMPDNSGSNGFGYGLMSSGTSSVTNIQSSSFRFKVAWLGSQVAAAGDLAFVSVAIFR